MNAKFWIASVAGGIFSFLLGWLIYGILLMHFMESQVVHYEGLMNPMPNLYLIFLANLLTGFFYTIVLSRWAEIRTFVKGLTGGLFLGFSMSLIYDLFMMSQMNLYTYTAMFVDIVATTVIGALTGGLIGWILGYEKKAAKA
ncbi:MAG TPA: hypothetical protein VMC08_09685 [Bacteroidales bacterium]|nr:hypothetical protein [Bacteroidales bacterium]